MVAIIQLLFVLNMLDGHGVTFLAFGNGAPDLFSAVTAITHNAPGIAIGAILGVLLFG